MAPKPKTKISGIYKISNIATYKIYIGSSENIDRRIKRHVSYLKRNVHQNNYLQNAYNKYSFENFRFDIVELCETSKLVEREQFYIDTLKPEYNLCPKAGSPAGRVMKEESKLKLSIARTGMKFSETHSKNIGLSKKGFKHSEKTKNKMRLAALNKKRPNQRKPDKWPHEKGNRCTCKECKEKISLYYKQRYKLKKINHGT